MTTIIQMLPTGVLLLLAIIGAFYIKKRDEKLDDTVTKSEFAAMNEKINKAAVSRTVDERCKFRHEEVERSINNLAGPLSSIVGRELCEKKHEMVDMVFMNINKSQEDLKFGISKIFEKIDKINDHLIDLKRAD